MNATIKAGLSFCSRSLASAFFYPNRWESIDERLAIGLAGGLFTLPAGVFDGRAGDYLARGRYQDQSGAE